MSLNLLLFFIVYVKIIFILKVS